MTPDGLARLVTRVSFQRHNHRCAVVNKGAGHPGCKVHTPTIERNERKPSDKTTCPTNNHYPLHNSLRSPLRASSGGGEGKPLRVWDREAKCSCYLSASISEPAGLRKWRLQREEGQRAAVTLSPDFCTSTAALTRPPSVHWGLVLPLVWEVNRGL